MVTFLVAVFRTRCCAVSTPLPSHHLWVHCLSLLLSYRTAVCSLDPPGMPHNSLYVGASFSSSNSTLAFSTRPSSNFSPVMILWCVVAIVNAPLPGPPVHVEQAGKDEDREKFTSKLLRRCQCLGGRQRAIAAATCIKNSRPAIKPNTTSQQLAQCDGNGNPC